MARMRTAPVCPFCLKTIAKARYQDQSDLPISMQVIGDTFIGWVYQPHECTEMIEAKKNMPKISFDDLTK